MKKLIVGNWKMNNTIEEAICLVKRLKKLLKDINNVDIAVCPPFTSLSEVSKGLKGIIELGAQNLFFEEKGAFTGEISPLMLKGLCKYVIIGHSERRNAFNESDELVNKKVLSALEHNLIPILCIGERIEEREKGMEKNIIEKQLKNGLNGINKSLITNVIIAYEPVWAIGTGRNATPQQAEEMHSFIKNLLRKDYGNKVAEKIRIIYGGSVNPENIKGLMQEKDIDGALVGGASLSAESFARIVRVAS